MRKDIFVFGYFAYKGENVTGATVKSRELYKELEKSYKKIMCFDTAFWRKRKLLFMINLLKALVGYKNIIFISGHESFHRILPVVNILNWRKKVAVHFVAIGSYGEAEVENHRNRENIKKISNVFVETKNMQESINKLGIWNVSILYNFKNLKPQDINDVKNYKVGNIYKLCYFARVDEEKGILDAINVIERVNRETSINILFDIYGKIEEGFEEKFSTVMSKVSGNITYKGIISADKSTETLKNYYILIFPTKYKAEGFPGTILDAFSAGLPILASYYPFYNEIMKENYTSISYVYKDNSDFYKKLVYALNHSEVINRMRINCLMEFNKYLPSNAVKVLKQKME